MGGTFVANWKRRYEKWNNFKELDVALKQQLLDMQNDEEQIEDAFYTGLQFGTGGIRGILGAGSNRLNKYMVRQAVKGLSIYLEQNRVNVNDRGVVIAYDSRYMSKEFALECAKVLGVHGIKTYVFSSLRPTPLLSFAVRHLQTVAGIMITASHNPPEYNGFKVYNEDGGQMTLEESDAVINRVAQITDELTIPVLDEKELEKSGLLCWISSE